VSALLSPAGGLFLLLAVTDALPPLQARFTPDQLRRIQAGETVVSVFQEEDRTEVLTLGAVRVGVGPDRLVACAREASCLHAHPDLEQAGRIEAVAAPAEPAGLSLDDALLDRLARCRVGKCGLRLSKEAIERFGSAVRWDDEGGRAAAASALMRQMLMAQAADYHAQGNRALLVFADRPQPASAGESMAVLLERGLPGLDAQPDLRRFLRDYPNAPDPGLADQYLMWYREHSFRRTLIGLQHVAVARFTAQGSDLALAVSKQVYASSFTNASLEMTAVAAPQGSRDGVLVIASRSRTDIRPSGFNWLERVLLRKMVGGRLSDRLKTLKSRLEATPAR